MITSIPCPSFDLDGRSPEQIQDLLAEHNVGLTVAEALKLQREILRRAPTLAELILFGIEGSEHCSYKSSRPYLKLFNTKGERVILGAQEDAGVIRVATDNTGRNYAAVLSHESHNHPSQLVPYEGAATGVGGNVRDVCCMGAKVVAQADDLRFGSLDKPKNKWLYEGVVSGIAGYGNPIGVPNIGGGLQFDSGYDDNCLVTVVSLGIMEEDELTHSYAPKHADGYDLILVGKPTDNSGFGGASFASFELEEHKAEQNKGAVQEPNAFLGRHMLKSSRELVKKLKHAKQIHRVGFKDLGAGGIACASVELADSGGYGAHVELENVHIAEGDYPAHVILCAETQERYMWVSPPDLTPMILDHYNREFALSEVSKKAAATVIGTITDDPTYVVTVNGTRIVEAPAAEVTRGFLYHREVGDLPPVPEEPQQRQLRPEDYPDILLRIISHENVASRSPVYEQYDKQVQGSTLVDAGDGDSGVITPFDNHDYPEEIRQTALTLTTDQNPRQNRINPYQGGVNAVAEAFCNTVSSGAEPIALSDCLCYGNPEKPDQMRLFAEGCRGVADAAAAFNIPVIAGNVSLYNESENGSIPPSPMIAVLGLMEDKHTSIPSRIFSPGGSLYLIGERREEFGGSIFYDLFGQLGSSIPRPDLRELISMGNLLRTAAGQKIIAACHDISEGGLAASLVEMTAESSLGCSVDIPQGVSTSEEAFWFSESFGFVLCIADDQQKRFLQLCEKHHITCSRIGIVEDSGRFRLGKHMDLSADSVHEAWRNGLRRSLS
jgi:phosphoribosylformylglycinamidine synthase